MEQEQAVVHVDIADGSTGLTVGTHIGQLVVLAEGLAVGGGANTASDIEFLRDDIVPDGINGLDIVLVASKGSDIGHTGIHIGSTDGVTHSLILFDNRLMGLGIVVDNSGLATIVEEELGLVEVFLVACNEVELGECHLCNLMTRHDAGLSRVRTYLFTYHIGIADGDVEELTATSSLIVSDGSLYHVSEVVELVAQVFLLAPAGVASPLMGLTRILGARGIEIAVRLLSRGNHVEHRVDIGYELLVRIGLQDVTGALDGLVGVCVVEG